MANNSSADGWQHNWLFSSSRRSSSRSTRWQPRTSHSAASNVFRTNGRRQITNDWVTTMISSADGMDNVLCSVFENEQSAFEYADHLFKLKYQARYYLGKNSNTKNFNSQRPYLNTRFDFCITIHYWHYSLKWRYKVITNNQNAIHAHKLLKTWNVTCNR
jgi:hypothetical protein